MRASALLLTFLLTHYTSAIRVYSGSALGQLTQTPDDTQIRRSWSGGASQPGLYKVKLTQRGYIQFLRYMVNVPALQQYTFCLWVNSANFTHNHPLFSYSRDERESMVKVWLSPSDKSLKISVSDQPILKVPLQLREGRWYHICQSWSGVTGEWNVFLDGVLKKSEKFPRHVGVMLPGGGDIAVGQELTDFNKGLDDGIEGEIFGFNMVDEAVDLQSIGDLKGESIRSDVESKLPKPSPIPEFKKMPKIQKTFDEIHGFISKLPSEPVAGLPAPVRSEKLRIGELPASSQPRGRGVVQPRPAGVRPTPPQSVVFREDRKNEPRVPGRRPGPKPRPSPVQAEDLNTIPNAPRPKINQVYDANYNMHAYKVPKRVGKPGDYKIFEKSDNDDKLEKRLDSGPRSDDAKKWKRQNFDIGSAWEANRAHPFYVPKLYDSQHRTHYHFETVAQPQTPISRRTFIVDEPVKIVAKTRASLPKAIPVREEVDEGFRRRRRRDTRRGSRQVSGFKPLPGLPEEFSELLNPTPSNAAILERLSAFISNRTDSATRRKSAPLLQRRDPQNFLPLDDVLLIEHNVHVPEVSQTLAESRISMPSQVMGSAGNELVRRSLSQCTAGRGSPLTDPRHILVSWADTPVRIYGGAIVSNANSKCGHF